MARLRESIICPGTFADIHIDNDDIDDNDGSTPNSDADWRPDGQE